MAGGKYLAEGKGAIKYMRKKGIIILFLTIQAKRLITGLHRKYLKTWE